MSETRSSEWATDVNAQKPLKVTLTPSNDLSSAVGWGKLFEVVNQGGNFVLLQKIVDPTTMTAIKAAHPGLTHV